MINAEYGQPALVRFENHLDENLNLRPSGLRRAELLVPDPPPQRRTPRRSRTASRTTRAASARRLRTAASRASTCDQLYLGYPAGGDDREKQTFFWFHDHAWLHRRQRLQGHGRPVADLRPEARQRRRDRPERPAAAGPPHEQRGRLLRRRLRHPDGAVRRPAGRRRHAPQGRARRQRRVPRWNPTHPEWWGKTFFRHFPNHGFVGDLFTVNGTAYPGDESQAAQVPVPVPRRSISRIYDFQLMRSTQGPKAARTSATSATTSRASTASPTAAVHEVHRDRHRRRAAALADPARQLRAVAGEAA